MNVYTILFIIFLIFLYIILSKDSTRNRQLQGEKLFDSEYQTKPSKKNFIILSSLCTSVLELTKPFYIQPNGKLKEWANSVDIINPKLLLSTEKYPKLGFVNQNYGVIGKIKDDPTTGIIVLRGTRTPSEAFNDIKGVQVPLRTASLDFPIDIPNVLEGYKIHRGFSEQYSTFTTGNTSNTCTCSTPCKPLLGQSFCETLNNCGVKVQDKYYDVCLYSEGRSLGGEIKKWVLDNPDVKNYIITGYSLGGAMAVLTALHINVLGKNVSSVYIFAGPKVGNPQFAELYNSRLGPQTFRFSYYNDQVPHLPLPFIPGLGCYRHVGFTSYDIEYWQDTNEPNYKCGSSVYTKQHGYIISPKKLDYNLKQIFGDQ